MHERASFVFKPTTIKASITTTPRADNTVNVSTDFVLKGPKSYFLNLLRIESDGVGRENITFLPTLGTFWLFLNFCLLFI